MSPSTRETAGLRIRERQGGAVLFISLIILIVMTIAGLAAMQGVGLDERMAGNLRDRTLAFEAAEAALREAEDVLDGAGLGALPEASAPTPGMADMLARGAEIEAAAPTAAELLRVGVAQLPLYLIEETAVVLPGGGVESDLLATRAGAEYYYAITALGYGSAPQARVMLQSVLARRF